jgi:predicted RND superfamily exporter protein
MYKEMKDGFPSEMLLLTILTIVAIFVIVALTFRSAVIPTLLIFAVMSGVYVNVFMSGLGGNTMYFLAYLIVQSILMGATIDYSILFMSYYREHRLKIHVPGSIKAAYHGAGHSIMTSGLILTLGPLAMSMFINDKMIEMILKCLATGALASILIIFLVLPGTIAICDWLVAPKGAVKSFGNKKK